MKRKASLVLTAGGIIFSGAFLLLSLNYANNVGLFYTKSSMPALYFSNQMEAAMSGIYAAPEESTVKYYGPYSCDWDPENLEYECSGGGVIRNVGASVGYTQNQISIGIPRTTCIYFNFVGLIAGRLGKGDEVTESSGGLSEMTKNVPEEAKEQALGEAGEEVGEAIGKKVPQEIGEEGYEEVWEQGMRRWCRENNINFDDFLNSKADDIALEAKKNALIEAKERATVGGVQRSEAALNFQDLNKIGEEAKLSYLDEIEKSLSNKKHSPAFQGLLNDMQEEAGLAAVSWSKYIPSRYSMSAATGGVWDSIKAKLGKEAGTSFLQSGWVSARNVGGAISDAASKAWDSFKSKIYSFFTQDVKYLRGLTGWLTCGGDNPWFMSAIEMLTNGQIYIEEASRTISRSHAFYVGKTGGISLVYVNPSGGQTDINKLYALNGDDMCSAREYLAYNLTEYAPNQFEIVEGAIVLNKGRGVYDTTCSSITPYYPTGLPEIVRYVHSACQLTEGEKMTRNIKIFSSPSRIITKQGTVVCEERVERSSDGRMVGSFKISCFDLADLCAMGEGLETFNPKNHETSGLGNLYENPSDIVDSKRKVSSPLLDMAGYEPPAWEMEDVLQPRVPKEMIYDKEFYLPSRYDYIELVARKQEGGEVVFDKIREVNVMGLNFNGIYTEDQLFSGFASYDYTEGGGA